MIAEDRVIRGRWTDTGKQRACLLAALVPECGEQKKASVCPADVMPRWLAELVPAIDDNGSAEKWPAMIRRFAALARRWAVLSEASWQRLEYTAKLIALDETDQHYDHDATDAARNVAKAVDDVRSLLKRAIDGDVPTTEEWSKAEATAARAASAEWASAASAAHAAARASASAARAADAAAARAADAAAAAWDQMTDAIFTAIENECANAEQRERVQKKS